MTRIMAWVMSWAARHEIVLQEVIRALAGLPIWLYILWGLQQSGLVAAPARVLLPIGPAISVIQFSVLVAWRKRSGRKLQITSIRGMLMVMGVVCLGGLTWRLSQGEVIQGILFVILMLLLGIATLFVMKKRGMNW